MSRFVAAVVLITLLLVAGGMVAHHEHEYEANTPAAEKARHVELAKQLESLEKGDLFEVSHGESAQLHIVHYVNHNTLYVSGYLSDKTHGRASGMLSRKTTAIVRKSDQGWPDAMKRFIEQ